MLVSMDLVILLEPDGPGMKLRAWELRQPGVTEIIERCHVAEKSEWVRTWRCDGERALSGQRIFREVLPPVPEEPAENPIFQELVIKEPLPFFEDETPGGFRRKHLRKA